MYRFGSLVLLVVMAMAMTPPSSAAQNSGNANDGSPKSSLPTKVHSECLATNDDLQSFACFTPSQKEDTIPCMNTHPECPNWAAKRECNKNPQFMLIQCREACDSCIDLHTLGGTSAPQIATEPHLQRTVMEKLVQSQLYMFREAEKDITMLAKCVNKHELCTQWTIQGECESNPSFMSTECAPSCQMCSKTP